MKKIMLHQPIIAAGFFVYLLNRELKANQKNKKGIIVPERSDSL